jgi:hypothetical protein
MTSHSGKPRKAKTMKKLERKTPMKTKLIKSRIAPLAVACALATMVAATATGQGTQGGRLQGTWNTQVSIIDCQTGNVIRTFPSLIGFMAGGTLTETTSGTAPALRTPGEGVWRHTTDNNYAFRFKHFNFNAQNVFTGWNIIQAEARVDATGNAYTTSGTVEVYDPNGVLLATGCSESVGTRFEL